MSHGALCYYKSGEVRKLQRRLRKFNPLKKESGAGGFMDEMKEPQTRGKED